MPILGIYLFIAHRRKKKRSAMFKDGMDSSNAASPRGISDPNKRADFVMSNQDQVIEIVEIKRPKHSLQNEEMERITKYVDLMTEFLDQAGNKDFKNSFPRFHVTLVCDELGLTGVHKQAFLGLERDKVLEHISWRTFLLRTKKMHEGFLNEAERQKRIVAK